MNNFFNLLATFCLIGIFSVSTNAQQSAEKCGFNHVIEFLTQQNPNYKQQIDAAYQQWVAKANAKQTKNNKTIYTIPVVFHVVWNTSVPQQNLDDSVLLEQIAVLNEDFSRMNADTSNTRSIFFPIVENAQIQFELACVDTNGNTTNGIVRVPTTTTFGGGFIPNMSSIAQIQNTSQGGSSAWNTSEYFNIWIGDINGGNTPSLLGIATPPAGLSNWPPNSIPPELTDGAIIQYNAFGRNNPTAISTMVVNGRTTTHEVGHYLGVRHTAENTFGGLFGSICGDDDGLNDTPNCDQSQQGCNFNRNSCVDVIGTLGDLPDMVENYMDYSDQDCQNSFTQGQTLIMRSVLENERIGLLNSPALSNCVVGLTEKSLIEKITIYPNPSNGIVTIASEENLDLKITIHNSLGQLVRPIIVSENRFQLSQHGIYFITIESNTSFVIKKVIIQ